jgi:hypothetical protein
MDHLGPWLSRLGGPDADRGLDCMEVWKKRPGERYAHALLGAGRLLADGAATRVKGRELMAIEAQGSGSAPTMNGARRPMSGGGRRRILTLDGSCFAGVACLARSYQFQGWRSLQD